MPKVTMSVFRARLTESHEHVGARDGSCAEETDRLALIYLFTSWGGGVLFAILSLIPTEKILHHADHEPGYLQRSCCRLTC